jgi:hypothetical protein
MGAFLLILFNSNNIISSFQNVFNHTSMPPDNSLQYRVLDAFDWEDSLSSDDEGNLEQNANCEVAQINFSRNKDAYGYAKAKLQYVHQVSDGT